MKTPHVDREETYAFPCLVALLGHGGQRLLDLARR